MYAGSPSVMKFRRFLPACFFVISKKTVCVMLDFGSYNIGCQPVSSIAIHRGKEATLLAVDLYPYLICSEPVANTGDDSVEALCCHLGVLVYPSVYCHVGHLDSQSSRSG